MAIILQAFYFQSEWFIQRYYREFTSGNLRKNWNQGYCEQTALNTSFAPLSQLENRRQLCVFLTPKSAFKSSRRTRRIFSLVKISLANIYVKRSNSNIVHLCLAWTGKGSLPSENNWSVILIVFICYYASLIERATKSDTFTRVSSIVFK